MPRSNFTKDKIILALKGVEEGLTQPEIAALMGCHMSAITRWLAQGRKDCRNGISSAFGRFANEWDKRQHHNPISNDDEIEAALKELGS